MKPSDAYPRTGYYWQRYEDGVLVESGNHNGTTLDGKDATIKNEVLHTPISMAAFQDIYKGNKK